MNIILLGKGTLAKNIAKWFKESPGYQLKYVIPVTPEPTWDYSLIRWCQTNGIAYIHSGHYQDLPDIKIDLAISVFYDKIIKAWFIDRCGKILNLHNGPLPKYRGVSPINWALKNEEREHGITIHEITPGIDDGPIVAQLKYSIYPEIDEVIDVYKRSLDYGFVLFKNTIPILSSIISQPQDHTQATYYSCKDNDELGNRKFFTRKDNENSIDWIWSLG